MILTWNFIDLYTGGLSSNNIGDSQKYYSIYGNMSNTMDLYYHSDKNILIAKDCTLYECLEKAEQHYKDLEYNKGDK